MQKRTLTYEEFQNMVRNAPPGSGINAQSIAASIEKKGYSLPPELSQFSSAQPKDNPSAKEGFFSTVSSALQKRNQAAFGSDTGLIESALNPSQTSETDSAAGRMLRGQQGLGSTVLQIGGQGAGLIGDITGAGLVLGGRAISALTPDAIEKPVVDAAKGVGVSILKTPAGQAGLAAIEKGTEFYNQWKAKDPVNAANLEAVVNIASLLPIGKGARAGKTALASTGVDDVAKGLGKAARESAEASVARTLNPTTIATKQTTQNIAGELVDRPLKETLALTRKGMQAKAGAAAEVAGEAIQQAGPLPGRTKTSALIDYLQSQKQQFMAGGKVVSKEGVESIDEVTRIIAQYGDDVDDEVLRDIRKIFDSEFYQGKKNIAKSAAETSTLNFKKKAADKIRSILAEAHPEVAKLNKEYTFWSSLEGVLEKTVARKTGQKQFMKGLATLGGATTGNTFSGKIIGALGFNMVASLIDSPAWGFVSAKLKNRLATALANSDVSEIGKILGSIPGLTAVQAIPDEQ